MYKEAWRYYSAHWIILTGVWILAYGLYLFALGSYSFIGLVASLGFTLVVWPVVHHFTRKLVNL